MPLRLYIQHFLIKYKKLSSLDLSILINDLIKTELVNNPSLSILPFKKLQSSISANLNKLKKEGTIVKIKTKQWALDENLYKNLDD